MENSGKEEEDENRESFSQNKTNIFDEYSMGNRGNGAFTESPADLLQILVNISKAMFAVTSLYLLNKRFIFERQTLWFYQI